MQVLNKSGVYQIVNKVSGSTYVGSAINLAQRRRSHWGKLRAGGGQVKLQCAWDSYGENAFEFQPLVVCSPCNLLMYEQLFIDEMAPKYNTRKVAHSNFGVKWGEVTLARMRNRADIVFHEVLGVRGPIEQLAKHFGKVSAHCASERVRKHGWTIEAAVCTPPMARSEILIRAASAGRPRRRKGARQFEVAGHTGSIGQLVDKFGIVSETEARNRVKRGWDVCRAVTEPKREAKLLSAKRETS